MTRMKTFELDKISHLFPTMEDFYAYAEANETSIEILYVIATRCRTFEDMKDYNCWHRDANPMAEEAKQYRTDKRDYPLIWVSNKEARYFY